MARQSKMPLPPNAAVDYPEAIPQPVFDLNGSEELDAANEEMPSEVPKPKAPTSMRKIKVRALRAGFIHQERKVHGSEFEVYEHELGSWMECLDQSEQKKHLKRIADKKRAANQQGIKDQARELLADD